MRIKMGLSDQDKANLFQFTARIRQIGIQPYEIAFWLLEKDLQTIDSYLQKYPHNLDTEATKLFTWVKDEFIGRFNRDCKIQQETLDYLLLY
ncbi:MAG: hypothetical protein SAQ54_15070 [Oscillatoria sp. PMC 1050.18]|nr:hypothetical protein [Oscillatoria sp. PMC 1050.18]